MDFTRLEGVLRSYGAGVIAMGAGYDTSAYDTPRYDIVVDNKSVETRIDTVIFGTAYEADLVLLRQDTPEGPRWYAARRYPDDLDFTGLPHYYVADTNRKTEILSELLITSRP
jgi:hypothetical protein